MDRRLLFTQGVHQYRIAFDEARKKGLGVLQGVAKRPEGDV